MKRENIVKINESVIRKMVAESLRSALDEIGETPLGRQFKQTPNQDDFDYETDNEHDDGPYNYETSLADKRATEVGKMLKK